MERESKLSPKERQLLEPFFLSDTYQQALKPVLERIGNGLARSSAEQAPTWDQVLVNRGKLQALKDLHKQLKQWNDEGRKQRETKKP